MIQTFPRRFAACVLEQRRRSLWALVALFVLITVSSASAGGGWIDDPGKGSVRIGYDWKTQPDAQRRDTKGELYTSLFNMTHDYRFLYLSGDVGVMKHLEVSCLFTYLWASEVVDSTSEDTSHYYNGLSDFWLSAKYQLLDGDYPVAVGATVRMPEFYESKSKLNGQWLTDIPGLTGHDYELYLYGSHSFPFNMYAQSSLGFRLREGAATNQILYSAEVGYTLPIFDNHFGIKAGFDGAASIGEPRPSTSADRFSGLTLERGSHLFDFHDASYLRPQVGLWARVFGSLDVGIGYYYIVWGHSTVVYQDLLGQVGFSF